MGHDQNPGSTDIGVSSSRGSSPRHSSRGRSLDFDLRNAPCYHAAIMRLLPSSILRRGLSLHPRPPSPPPSALPHFTTHTRRNRGLKRPSRPAQQKSRARQTSITALSVMPPPPAIPPPPAACHYASLLDNSFKSGAVYLEVKLAELQSCAHKCASENGAGADARCFGVCWQLLGELSSMKTPFRQVLSTIYCELDKSIHSSFVAAKSGSISSTFQLVPYFELVAKSFRARKLELEVERENLEASILACQSEIGRIEQDVQVSKEKLKLAEGVGREMERSLTAILGDLEATLTEVRTLQGDILQFKRKMQKAKVNQIKAHEVKYEQMMRHERRAKLEENYNCMWQDLQDAQAEIDVVRYRASESVPKEELGVAKAKVDELQKTLADLQAKADTQIVTSGELTPRPLWEELLPARNNMRPHNYSTAELLSDVCKHNISLTFNISQLQQHCAIVQASIAMKHGTPDGIKQDHEQNATSEIRQSKVDGKIPQDLKSRPKKGT